MSSILTTFGLLVRKVTMELFRPRPETLWTSCGAEG